MRYRCNMASCGQFPHNFEFEGRDSCPRCGASDLPHVVPLIDVHFVVLGSGPITGAEGRQYVACQPRRDAMARHDLDQFAATGEPAHVTCPACLATAVYRRLSGAPTGGPPRPPRGLRRTLG